MVAWPENGTTNWNTAMAEFVAVEHNTDGTHDLSTIGWTETAVITKDMTDADAATSTVSSLSFQPRLVIFFASVSGTSAASWGADDGTTADCVNQLSTGNMSSNSSASIDLEPQAGEIQSASITSLSATGFTLTWSKTLTPTGNATIIALCFK
jgi:flavin reductase (DIM6/NTAB) family NADH-FMN oxidoreductase RutF